MTENEAVERLECMRLFMQINDKDSESKFIKGDYIESKIAIKDLEEIQQYRAIGTVEECREARERQIPFKPYLEMKHNDILNYWCLICNKSIIPHTFDDSIEKPLYCTNCGQKLDWSE